MPRLVVLTSLLAVVLVSSSVHASGRVFKRGTPCAKVARKLGKSRAVRWIKRRFPLKRHRLSKKDKAKGKAERASGMDRVTDSLEGGLSWISGRLDGSWKAADGKLGFARRAKRLGSWVAASRVGSWGKAVGRAAAAGERNFSAVLTGVADWVHARLPKKLSCGFRAMRALNPISLTTFVGKKIYQYPTFFAVYGTFSLVFTNGLVPVLAMAGMDLMTVTAIRFGLGVPVDLGAVLLWEHKKRPDRRKTLTGTAVDAAKQYVTHVRQRRERDRKRFVEIKTNLMGRLHKALAKTDE